MRPFYQRNLYSIALVFILSFPAGLSATNQGAGAGPEDVYGGRVFG